MTQQIDYTKKKEFLDLQNTRQEKRIFNSLPEFEGKLMKVLTGNRNKDLKHCPLKKKKKKKMK